MSKLKRKLSEEELKNNYRNVIYIRCNLYSEQFSIRPPCDDLPKTLVIIVIFSVR
jgi:hypothetical protein